MRDARDATSESDAFGRMYDTFYREVLRYCLVLTRSMEDAEDVASEAFERALRSGRRSDGQITLPWLLLTARRIVIDRSRRRRVLAFFRLTPAVDLVDRSGDPDRVEFWLWFDRLATALTDRQRDVLVLRYQLDLTDRQIADVLGLSEAGVRSLSARAIAALRNHPESLR